MDGQRRPGDIVARAWGLGTLAGIGVGGLVGTLIVPLFGTFGGAVVGAVGGSVCGMASGMAIAVAAADASLLALRALGGLITAVGALLEALVVLPQGPVLGYVGFAAMAGALGAWLAPQVVSTTMWGRPAHLLGHAMAACGVGGTAAGGLVGLVVGLYAYPPTAPFAAVEGGVFGGTIGVVLGFWVGVLQCAMSALGERQPRRHL